ncbi:hypothetical protein NIES267_09990 [Calothrix parasitica NIES-267]|uniref:WD-40 repeat-containing protein n=1 Tax=Calothrix parasitica NIES-267 TaxID=1973488 RepID=A0A1Z4LJW0_9CYAN|nr:hypothetical protein NIES267_09990 [Calothrix parasitica NIES-267]
MINSITTKKYKKKIKVQLSKPEITIIPNSLSEDNEFKVTVINETRDFISFQLELLAPGLEDKSDINWYTVEPEICTKNPPGSETEFQVSIIKPPIPAYNQTVDLEVKAFCIEDEKLFNSENIRLKIENSRPKIELKLPLDELEVKPGEKKDIPVIVTNLSSNLTYVELQFFAEIAVSGLDKVFPIDGYLNSQSIPPGKSKVFKIPCKILDKTKPGKYEFTVTDISDNNYYQSNQKDRPLAKEFLNVLPHGVIEFKCDNPVQEIPNTDNDSEGGQSDTAEYKLEFENQFKLKEEIGIHIRGKNLELVNFHDWESVKLESPNQRPIIDLKISKQRPLFGWTRQFTFLVEPYLKSNNNVSFQPEIKLLKLKVAPKIPFLIQLLGLISVPLLFLSLINYFRYPRHDAPVTSVVINDLAGTVISGSSDRTIRRWQVNSSWFGNKSGLKFEDKVASEIPKAVRVIRFSSRNPNVVAVGLENGEIHLKNFDSGKRMGNPLLEDKDIGNRVFDLEFTSDSRTLIAAYGGGQIKQWNLNQPILPKENNAKFTISTLDISENSQLPLVVVGGQFNKLGFWDWKNGDKSKIYHLPYYEQDSNKNNSIFGKQDYITSLAIADKKDQLITADNQGTLKVWDLNKIRECINKDKLSQNNQGSEDRGKIPETDPEQKPIPLDCGKDEVLLNKLKLKNTHTFPSIRSIAITKDESYLASAGDDGNVRIWNLKKRLTRKPISLINTGKRLNTVDIKFRKIRSETKKELLVVTGDDDNRVMLYRVKIGD